MKSLSVLVLLFLLSFYSNGQTKNVSIGLIGSVDFSTYNLDESYFVYDHSEYKSAIGYTTGLGLQFKIHKKIFVETGLTWSNKGYEVKYDFQVEDPGDPVIPLHSEISVSYLNIPLKIGYQIFKLGEFQFSPVIGLNTGYQINETNSTLYADSSVRESKWLTNDLNEMQLMLSLDLGFEYQLGNKFKIRVAPYFGKGLIKMNDTSMKSGQWSYGGMIGLYYNF